MLYILTAVLPLLLALPSGSLGASITLSSADDFTNFVNDVNTGKNDYSNITVYLGSDISLLENADPIGNSTYQFLGTFDGQGHVISNLTMNTSTAYAGLFGYSDGLAIKNVILDDSCSITITHSKYDHAHVGGIIGECCSKIGECDIENCVNMAGVSFNKTTISLALYIGGVAGRLESSSIYNAHIENCVNYGSVTYSGTVSSWVDLGGIVGYGDGSSTTSYSYIQNCLNYGTITYSGKARSYFDIGGVVGNCASYAYIENCVSAGKIVTQTTISEKDHVGSIVGRVSSQPHINYCYYTSDVNVSSINGTGTPNSTTGTPNSPTSVDTDLVNKLNSNATSSNWTKWLLNANNATVTFKVSDDRELSFSSQIILLIPDPVKEGNTFLFWCKDTECNNVFDPATESISGNIVLYSGWVNSTVTFDFNNGTTVNATFTYNTSIEYPKGVPEKEGYTFSQWGNYHEFMPARDITVTALWTPNNYTVTLDVNGGNELDKNETIVTFDEEYGDLPEPNRVKHTFIGWFINETDIEVTNETIVTIPRNHTLYAHWEEGPNTVPMAEIVVPAVVVVAVAVAIVLIIITKKEHNKNDATYGGYMKVNDVEDDEMLSNI